MIAQTEIRTPDLWVVRRALYHYATQLENTVTEDYSVPGNRFQQVHDYVDYVDYIKLHSKGLEQEIIVNMGDKSDTETQSQTQSENNEFDVEKSSTYQ